MSTKTNFKRIALVAVAALGMGVLSSAPSQAAFSGTAGSQLTVTVANGTGTLAGSKSDSTTAGTVSVVGLALATLDSYTVTSSIKTVPGTTTLAAAPRLLFLGSDTATSTGATVLNGESTTVAPTTFNSTSNPTTWSTTESRTSVGAVSGSANTYVNAKWYAYQESITARVAGTYTYTVIVTPFTVAAGAGTAQVVDITITIGALASAATAASPAS